MILSKFIKAMISAHALINRQTIRRMCSTLQSQTPQLSYYKLKTIKSKFKSSSKSLSHRSVKKQLIMKVIWEALTVWLTNKTLSSKIMSCLIICQSMQTWSNFSRSNSSSNSSNNSSSNLFNNCKPNLSRHLWPKHFTSNQFSHLNLIPAIASRIRTA